MAKTAFFDSISRVGTRESTGHFNIDHVLIGPGGIFTVETKDWSLPAKGTRAEVVFDPGMGKLTWPDGRYDTAEANQAVNNAEYVRKELAKRTGRPAGALPVRPVLLLPGWYITNTARLRNLWCSAMRRSMRFFCARIGG